MAESVCLSVPAKPAFARSVRMTAANLAVLCSMSVDEVEDARMAAEEAFVYACATGLKTLEMTFEVSDQGLSMEFALGPKDPAAEPELAEQTSLAQLLLAAVSDECTVSEDGAHLTVVKRAGAAHAA